MIARYFVLVFFCITTGLLSAQDGYVKEFYFPKAGLRMSYPLTAKEIRNTDSIITYTYEHFDNSGKNIGAGEVNIYPHAENWSREELIRQTKEMIKEYKMGDSYEVLNTEVKVRKGVFELVIIKSVYRFKNDANTVGREDYFYRGCKGVAHFMFLVPSYNCYLTEYRRSLITHNYFKWYNTNLKENVLNISYTYPKGLFYVNRHANNKGLAFRSCTPEYKSEIDLYKLDTTSLDLKAVAAKRFSYIKSQTTGGYDWKEYSVDTLANPSKVLTHSKKIENIEYRFHEYVFKAQSNFFAVRVKSTCSDIDQCGPNFLEEVEKIISAVHSYDTPKNKEEDEEDYYWGY